MTAAPVILCLNSGSSSLKFALYQLEVASDTTLAEGSIERIGLPTGRLWVHAQTSGAGWTSLALSTTIKRRCRLPLQPWSGCSCQRPTQWAIASFTVGPTISPQNRWMPSS